MPLVLSPELSLPDTYTTKTAGILAQRRKGKSYTAMVIAEEMCDAGIPWVAIDPTGAWWGLRAGANGGAGGGRPVVILGGQHGDIPLERGAGSIVADLVVDQPGWYILDLSAFESKAAEREFVTAFAKRIYYRKGQPGKDFALHLFVDEADIFVSQSADKGDKAMLSAFEAIVRRGGIRGIGTTLISQRSAVVHKNVLEQLDILIALRTVGPNDQAAVKRFVSAQATPEQLAEMMGSLASLDIGEAYVWEPGEDIFARVHIRKRKTFNSSATPKAGEVRVEPKGMRAIDLELVAKAMADTVEKAKADDPKALRAQIMQLTRENLALTSSLDARKAELDRHLVRIDALEGDLAAAKPQLVPFVPEEVLVGIKSAVAFIESADEHFQHGYEALHELMDTDWASFEVQIRETVPNGIAKRPEVAANAHNSTIRAPKVSKSAKNDKSGAPEAETAANRGTGTPDPGFRLGKGHKAVLSVLAQRSGPMDRKQLGFFAKYSPSGGGFNNIIGKLRTEGLVSGGWPIEITYAGLGAIDGEWEPLPTGPDALEYWADQIGGMGAKMLRALAQVGPLDREELGERVGAESTGGGFNNAVGKLRTAGLVTDKSKGWPVGLSEEFAQVIAS